MIIKFTENSRKSNFLYKQDNFAITFSFLLQYNENIEVKLTPLFILLFSTSFFIVIYVSLA